MCKRKHPCQVSLLHTSTLPSHYISYSTSWENVMIYQSLLVLMLTYKQILLTAIYTILTSSSWENLMTYQASRHQNTISHYRFHR